MKRLLTALLATAALTAAGTATANASVEFPTTGDTITYIFESTTPHAESIFWTDADNEDRSIPAAGVYNQHVNFKSFKDMGSKGKIWGARVSFTSRSTTQLTGAYISAYDSYWVRCTSYVNGVKVDQQYATGKYATAFC